jgi:heme exporter protein B
MMGALALLWRDTVLTWRIGGGGLMGAGFFLLVVTLVPLGVGGEPETLARIAGGILWVAALLACLLSLDRLFQADYEDGSLDLIVLAPLPLEATVMLKALAHWLTTGLPLVVLGPVLALTLNLPAGAYGALFLSLVIGTPGLSLIGAVGAALTVGVRRGGLLLSALVLPLYIPTLVFGAQAVDRAAVGLDASVPLMMLAAMTLIGAGLGPFAAAAALRVNLR